jgi:hypothetical protein
MTYAELQQIQEELGFSLPSSYRATMLAYPFSKEPGKQEPMLVDDLQEVLDLNTGGLEMDGVGCPFFVGSDGSERYYFVDANEPLSPVYWSEVETGHFEMQAASWAKYLSQIRHIRKEQGLGSVEAIPASRWWPFQN